MTTNARKRRERLSAQDARTRAERYAEAERRRQAFHDDAKVAAAEVAAGKVTTCTARISGCAGHRGFHLIGLVPGQPVSVPNSLVGTFVAAGVVTYP